MCVCVCGCVEYTKPINIISGIGLLPLDIAFPEKLSLKTGEAISESIKKKNLDSPFTVVDAFSLSYLYLPFFVDLFYLFTYFVWWGDLIFRRLLNWVRLLAVKWENKKHLHKITPIMFVDLSSCPHCLSSWYFGSAHSLEKVMGVITRLGGAGVYILDSYTIGLLTNGPCSCYAGS